MNRVQIRDTLVSHMQTVWTSHLSAVPVFYKRQHDVIDMMQITGDWFIKFTVIFEHNDQANIDPSPFHRTSGTIAILLFGKEGQSDRTWQQYMDELIDGFKLKALSTGLHTKVPTPGKSEGHDGWCSEELRIPFFADSNT